MTQAELKIMLLGGVTITQGETAVANFASRKAEALLIYLACNPRPHPRETLAALLWPENAQNRALAQHEQCARILDDELGVEPDEETTALYEAIRDEGVKQQGDKAAPLPPHNLPTAANAFIGREAELAAIQDWLGKPDGRLLTIVGPGGIGKTRLAQEAPPVNRRDLTHSGTHTEQGKSTPLPTERLAITE